MVEYSGDSDSCDYEGRYNRFKVCKASRCSQYGDIPYMEAREASWPKADNELNHLLSTPMFDLYNHL